MNTTQELLPYNSKDSFRKIFDFKGKIAPIAEKANRNFAIKTKDEIRKAQRLHYFVVGHTFKHIDTEQLFEKMFDEELKNKRPYKFLNLQHFNSDFCDHIGIVLSNIRDINCHFIHDFEKLTITCIQVEIIAFLKESFELAVIQTYLKEKKISAQQFLQQKDTDTTIVAFLCEQFYPLDENKTAISNSLAEYISFRNTFKSMTKDEAIHSLLFVAVADDIPWKLDDYTAFTITKGTYLSFNACLFLLSLFLYKDEANQLISKIKGFKKNKTAKEKSKQEVFSFFSKRFSSQDIDSEENHLVKFRDLIHYLNKYPVNWNKDIELESKHPVMTDQLLAKIIEIEIGRAFPDKIGNTKFHTYIKEKLWKIPNNILFSPEEKKEFDFEINKSPELKQAKKELYELQTKTGLYGYNKIKNEKEIKKTQFKIDKIRHDINHTTERLKNQLAKNYLIVSYGRNQDRFMEFATRYLAEKKYFGADATFKMYRFFSTEEQNAELEKCSVDKKVYDNLRFHQGRLVHFSTFDHHREKYKSWDMPFVIENNAIQVKLSISYGNGKEAIEKTISIQRALMIYFLEDALFHADKHHNIENNGSTLLKQYDELHDRELIESKAVLEQNDRISIEQKKAFKKILPKRLLHGYSPAVSNYCNESNTLATILEKAKQSEERYKNLLEKAKNEGNYDDFIKRNKGKQYKLQFIKRAWHLMYFKDSYAQQVKSTGEHHKNYHITRDEFNDFCRYMFAFDDVPAYKDYLTDMLDKKLFFENISFKTLFEKGNSLDQLYSKTKETYQTWIQGQHVKEQEQGKYSLENYENIFQDNMLYINVSHFAGFLKTTRQWNVNDHGIIQFSALENKKHLIEAYYYADKLDKTEYKSNRKLFNELKTIKLEDALLYEIAMHYLRIESQIVEQVRTGIIDILNQDIRFSIENKDNKFLYELTVPFKKIDSYVGLLGHKKEQENTPKFNGHSFLATITDYLEKVQYDKDIQAIYKKFKANSNKPVLSFDDLHKIDAHLITHSIKFTSIALAMEKYFIVKQNKTIETSNRIAYDEIDGYLKPYFSETTRNKAFHFGIPEKSYETVIGEIETKFLENEVKPKKPTSFQELNKQQRTICKLFIESIHSYFIKKEKDSKKKWSDAEQQYYEQLMM